MMRTAILRVPSWHDAPFLLAAFAWREAVSKPNRNAHQRAATTWVCSLSVGPPEANNETPAKTART